MLESVRDWRISFKDKLNTDTVYIDFAHAFDGITLSKITAKLIRVGINGKLLDWIVAFLSNRFQCVVLESCFSDWSPVISGVPQGSVLGPTLFIIFIDSIGSLFNGDLCHQLYADDLKLYTCIKNDISVFSLQSALDRLEQWYIT